MIFILLDFYWFGILADKKVYSEVDPWTHSLTAASLPPATSFLLGLHFPFDTFIGRRGEIL